MRPHRLLATLALGLVLLTGCGAGDDDGPAAARQQIAARVSAYVGDYLAGHGREACAHYAPALRAMADRRARYVGLSGCADVLGGVGPALARRLPAGQRRRIVAALSDRRSVRVDLRGSRAFAALDLGPGVPATSTRLELALVDGDWLITHLGVRR